MAEDIYEEALELHRRTQGKISVETKIDVKNTEMLSLVYSPGVAEPCRRIAADPSEVYALTMKNNSVAIVTDGSAVLGLGNIGAAASIPVMEGKAMLFKKFADIDAFPICLDTQDPEEIIKTVRYIAPIFGGVNLEDIASPNSFIIESALQDLGIPVFHDDQHGTAIVTLAALINSSKVVGKSLESLNVVINGAGAAGIAIAQLLRCVNFEDADACRPVNDIIVCDSKGIIHANRDNLNFAKKKLLSFTNRQSKSGSLSDALVGADVFIGVSKGNLLTAENIQSMAARPIVFALANPTPEIMPDLAKSAGAAIIATGRSDFPNQVNNVLGFPGIFRGALDARAKKITGKMKYAAALAIAECVEEPSHEMIVPASLNRIVAYKVAQRVQAMAG